MESKNCKICNNLFYKNQRSLKWWLSAKFCSVKCSGFARKGLPLFGVRKWTEERKKIASALMLGNTRGFSKNQTPWNKGMKGLVLSRKFFDDNPVLRQEKHPRWLGDKVSYRGIHKWVEAQLGKPCRCDFCGNTELRKRQYHWANKSRNYQRIIEDWIRLYVKCHKVYDRAENQL